MKSLDQTRLCEGSEALTLRCRHQELTGGHAPPAVQLVAQRAAESPSDRGSSVAVSRRRQCDSGCACADCTKRHGEPLDLPARVLNASHLLAIQNMAGNRAVLQVLSRPSAGWTKSGGLEPALDRQVVQSRAQAVCSPAATWPGHSAAALQNNATRIDHENFSPTSGFELGAGDGTERLSRVSMLDVQRQALSRGSLDNEFHAVTDRNPEASLQRSDIRSAVIGPGALDLKSRAALKRLLRVQRALSSESGTGLSDEQDEPNPEGVDMGAVVAALEPYVPELAETEAEQGQHGQSAVQRHTRADCDAAYERCGDTCRALPPNARRRRALCWAGCMATYATCLASAEETLTAAAIVAAIVLAAADGPLPIGDAAAVALLAAVGVNLNR